MNAEERAYLASFFDGEGCFSITVHNRYNSNTREWKAVAVISQSERRKSILEKYQEKTGLGSITRRRSAKPNGELSPYHMYQWRINSMDIDCFIDLIYDFLEAKRVQADIVRRFRSTFARQGGLGGAERLSPTTAYVREECRQELHKNNDLSHLPLIEVYQFANDNPKQLRLEL